MGRSGSQVVIFNEDKSQVLLMKREDFRVWAPPGGMMEEGETAEETAIREAFEETGYHVAIDYFVGRYRRPQFNSGIINLFAGHIIGGDGSNRSWEAVAVEWFPVDALPKRMFGPSRQTVQDARFATELPVERDQYFAPWMVIIIYIGLKVRNARNWLMGRE